MKHLRRLVDVVRDGMHLQAKRIRTNAYAEQVQRDRDGLPAADRGLALAWADALDSMSGRSSR